MKRQDFHFDLPQELIAQYPLENRSDSRLLCYDRSTGELAHRYFRQLSEELKPSDLLVMNNSEVIRARVYAQKLTGGQTELLVERVLDDKTFLAQIKGARALRANQRLLVGGESDLRLLERRGELFLCETAENVYDFLHHYGRIPLPPYIERQDEGFDAERYQTIYARNKGSVAAPTAGLHFDEALLANLTLKGVESCYVTLHVGAGTFQPVRTDNILDHHMHSEHYSIEAEACQKIEAAKKRGGRVIAVGTTALRTLESVAREGTLRPKTAETDIFIYPGFQFKLCDGLITNFHLPESTLIMLVSAFIGLDATRQLYQEAISQKYRFFSYGDASLLI